MLHLYNIGIYIYSLIVRLVSIKNPKAKLWCEGRRNLLERMEREIKREDRIIWIHVASLGEFEQGRPLMEHMRATHPEYKILLTFFSPSGYEIRKGYKGADYIFYLPIDTTANARRFLDIAHPEIAIFVKYEYWLNLLFELRKRGIRSFIVSAIFRRNSIFFKSWGSLWRKALESFETLFVQDNGSQKLLAELGFDNVVVAGDTRFDRVLEIARSAKNLHLVERFKGQSRVVVAGSTWPLDEQVLEVAIKRHSDVKFIIAPHEIDPLRIAEVEAITASRAVKYTDIISLPEAEAFAKLDAAQVLILDTMGMLSSLYQYGYAAYIGGGFGVGIHNTLEAATFGLPIAFGTNYSKFKEAKDMVSLGACHSISNAEEFDTWLSKMLNNSEAHAEASRAAKEYTNNMSGATTLISKSIFLE